MPKYSIHGIVGADKHIGEIEAANAEEAIEKAWRDLDCSSPNICHQCSNEVNIGDVYKLIATNTEDDKDTLESD